MIIFADRGLTKNGEYNVRLFEILSWLWFIVSTLIAIFQHLPLAFLPDAPANLVHGNIWDLKIGTHDYRGKGSPPNQNMVKLLKGFKPPLTPTPIMSVWTIVNLGTMFEFHTFPSLELEH